MPVYLRQHNDIPTPTISDIGENDEDDFLQDPDQRWDKLPQPFRFLNKILISVFERAWEIANSREVERITEAAKIRPAQYECASKVKEFGNTSSMCNTPDGKFVIFGLTCGIAAVDALTGESVAIWQHDGVEIVSITCCGFDTDVYMICAIDDMGHGRLFCLASGVIFSVQTMNEEDASTKSHVNKFEASPKGDFIGIFFENPSTKENWLEIHKTSRDAWTKELETAITKSAAKQLNNAEQVNPRAPSPTEHVEENVSGDNKNQLEDTTAENGETDLHGPDATSQNNTPRGFKFTTTTLVLKVRPPSSVQGVQWSSPFQLSKTVDNGSVIGTGLNHLVSTHHLETRMSVSKALHEQHIKYLPDEEKLVAREPTFHFLAPGRMIPFGLESPHISGETNSVMVWWTNHNQIQHFNLVKPAKEVEHKPDLVWPTSSHIVATAVSPCTSLVAVAVDSGIVTIWDKYIGMKRRSVYVSENIQQLLFLDPSVCPQEESSYPPYTTSTNCYLLVWCKDGRLYLVNCASGCDSPPSDVSASLDGPDDLYTVVRPVDGIPELMLTCRSNGRIYLHNIVTTDVLCEVILPSPYEVFNPWQPVTSAGGHGQTLYIRGKLKPNHQIRSEQNSKEENSAEQDGVFAFHLCSFPTLEPYHTRHRPSIPYTVHNTVEARVDALFRERIAQQVSRKTRMQDRWNHLKDELDLIKQLGNRPSQPRIRTNLDSPLSVKRSPLRRVDSEAARIPVN